MRLCVLIALAAALLLAACSGESAPLTAVDQPIVAGDAEQPAVAGLADLPSPREVSVGDSVIDVSSGTRSFMLSTAMYFGPIDGIRQDTPDFMLIFEPSTEERLTHTFFPLLGQLDDQSVTLGQVSLDMEWHGDAPADYHGIYVGVPDYVLNTWIWRGPARSASDILDFASLGLNGNPAGFAFDKVALVNYSDVEVKVRYFNFTTVDPSDETGDELLFFITNEGGSFAINYATTADLDTASTIYSAGPGVELANLHVLETTGEPLLVFDRRRAGGNWEVWQTGLDGSNAQVRYSGAQDVCFSVTTPDNNYEYTLEGSGPDYYSSLIRHMPGNAAAELVSEMPGVLEGGGYWYGNGSTDASVVGSGLDQDGRRTIMLYSYSSYLDQHFFVPMIYLEEGASAYDPFYFIWGNNGTFTPRITLYSVEMAGDDTNELRAYYLSQTTDVNNKTFISDSRFSLRYPSVSPDDRLLSVVACQPGMNYGELYVQSTFLRELDASAGIAANVVGTPAWYDPTPPVYPEQP